MGSSCRNRHFRFTFLWMQEREEEEETSRHVDTFVNFFRSQFGGAQLHKDPYVHDVGPCAKGAPHEETVYKGEAVVTLLDEETPMRKSGTKRMKAEADQEYAQFGRMWSSSADRSLQWLQPNRSEGFWQGGTRYERNVRLAVLGFGTLVGLCTFAQRHLLVASHPSDMPASPPYSLHCLFKHDERFLHIYIDMKHAVGCTHTSTIYRMVVPYSSILRIVVRDPMGRGEQTDVFLQLKAMALLYRQATSVRHATSVKQSLQDAKKVIADIDFEQHQFERVLCLGCECSSLLPTSELSGCSLLRLGIHDKFKGRQILGRLSKRCDPATGLYYAPIRIKDMGHSIPKIYKRFVELADLLPFPVSYALFAVLCQGDELLVQTALMSSQQQRSFLEELKKAAIANAPALERALFALRTTIEARNIVNIAAALPQLFISSQLQHPLKAPVGTCLVRRMVVSPSRLVFLPPQVHSENRVLRQFDPDYALRVSFRNDDLQRLSFCLTFHSEKDKFLDKVVGKFLRQGVLLGGRHFCFLAASSSQLRDHGVWLYAQDTDGNTAESIRRWMGDFRNVRGVAKRMARMGQCFSSTEETVAVPLKGGHVELVPDVKGGMHPILRTPYVFSDGIGGISPDLLNEVCGKLGLSEVPSAIQIRYAGYKGMLCVNAKLKGLRMTLRPSMRKFECSSSDKLEVIKISAPRPVFLNRQLITILEQLGVEQRVFLQLQQNNILWVTDALASETQALEVLLSSSNTNGLVLLEGQLPLKQLQGGGLRLTSDPFFRSLLLSIYREAVDNLRSKSRIAVPPNKGRNMLGVLDETGTLAYGQVFVQYTELDHQNQVPLVKVLSGIVMVTKCPCLHPGDVRKFRAVDVPALHSIRDCIVFPVHGDRPHPNEMAGSDLDGDEYIVIWEKNLFFPGSNRDPMTFDDDPRPPRNGPVAVNDMIEFVCNYMKHDNVGIISNAHLAWADQEEHGIFSRVCLGLARKVSKSLDFVKTGCSAPYLDRAEKPIVYPDFMEKGGNKNSYRSKRVLGQLYRIGRSLEASVSASCDGRYCGDEQWTLLEFPGWKDYQEMAGSGCDCYAARMEKILQQFGIQSEGEVVTGIIHSTSVLHCGNKEMRNMELLVKKQYHHLVEKTREEFFKEIEDECSRLAANTPLDKQTVTLQMASACYQVTYADTHCSGQHKRKRKLYGYPWCMADVMLELLRESRKHSSQPELLVRTGTQFNSVIAKINSMLTKEVSAGHQAEQVAREVVFGWARKEELLESKKPGPCHVCSTCLDALFDQFLAHHYSTKENDPNQKGPRGDGIKQQYFEGDLTSPGSLIVGFLRDVSSEALWQLECCDCNVGAARQQTHVLTHAALRTYSMLALSCDPCHLGLPCDSKQHEPFQEVQEGNPLRLLVESDYLKEQLRDGHEEVEEMLRKWSGVHEVHIRGSADRHQRSYILVSATGRDWQRWFLEELLLQPWLPTAIMFGTLNHYSTCSSAS